MFDALFAAYCGAPLSVRVIGIGSPFAADQLGWRAVEILCRHPDLYSEDIEWITLDRPGAGLIQYLDPSRTVLLCDACIAPGIDVGNTLFFSANDLPDQISGWSNSHGIGLREALLLARSLDVQLTTVYLALLSVNEPQTLALDWSAPVGFERYLAAIETKLKCLIQH